MYAPVADIVNICNTVTETVSIIKYSFNIFYDKDAILTSPCTHFEEIIDAMLDVSAAILDNSFKTSTPFIDTVINETL